MQESSYTLVGIMQDPKIGLLMGPAILFGVWIARNPKRRWFGIGLALGSALTWLAPEPSGPFPGYLWFFLFLGILADAFIQRYEDGIKKWRLNLAYCVTGVAMVICIQIYLGPRVALTLDEDRLVTATWRANQKIGDRNQLTITEQPDHNGGEATWWVTKKGANKEQGYIASLYIRQLYRNSQGRILNGAEVASEVARWAGVKIIRQKSG